MALAGDAGVAQQGSLEARLTSLVSVLAHERGDDIGLDRLILAGDLEANIPECWQSARPPVKTFSVCIGRSRPP